MCGIAGLVRFDGAAADAEIARRMTQHLVHRGPDADGALSYGPIALGMRRLAVIDVAHGNQPIFNETGTVGIVYNGELYNFRELRAELIACGHRFATRSDTEVVVHAYEQWGSDCVRRFNGMFAFAILDRRIDGKPVLFVARDHLGIKPLYFWSDGETLLFASEVRALLASGLITRKLDLDGVRSYLAYGSVQEPYTLIHGITSLAPASTLTISGREVVNERYWRLPAQDAVKPWDESRVDEVRIALFNAVEAQLIADVPLGVFLSGGIDSTAIAALMSRTSSDVRSFSLVFDEADYDERHYARIAARHIGTEHHELHLSGAVVRDALPHALGSFDQPSADGLNTYFVSKAARDAGLTVALSGVGGDELFGGYDNHRTALRAEKWGAAARRIPKALYPVAAGALARWGGTRYRRVTDLFGDGALPPYFQARRFLSEREVSELLDPAVVQATQAWRPARFGELAADSAERDPVNRVSALELQTYLLSTLLRDTDQMSMAHSLEIRVPLLDVQLVELLFEIDGSHKISTEQPKPLLTHSLGHLMPRESIFRPKQGFVLPIASWLRGTLEERVSRSFLQATPDEAYPFTPRGLQAMWRRFISGEVGWGHVWAVFILRTWIDQHDCES
jgi:asparagine synthase (glutamine-hydrolysing)